MYSGKLSVLVMLAAYAGCEAAQMPIGWTLSGMGLLMAATVAMLAITAANDNRRQPIDRIVP